MRRRRPGPTALRDKCCMTWPHARTICAAATFGQQRAGLPTGPQVSGRKVDTMKNLSSVDRIKEIDLNLDFFLKELPKLRKDSLGRYALLKNRQIIGLFDTIRDAELAGGKMFADKIYSVQKVDDAPINLGFYSHAVHVAAAQ
jgi:hypothetical protein